MCSCWSLAASAAGRITVRADSRRAEITAGHHYRLLLAGPVRGPWRGHWRGRKRRVVLWPVSCGVAGGGAGYARAARRAGSCCPLVSAGRPRRVPALRRWVKNHPPRTGARAFACCRHVTAFPACLVSPQRAGPLPGPIRQACAARVALALTRALHSWSGCRSRAPGHWGAPRGCWLPGGGGYGWSLVPVMACSMAARSAGAVVAWTVMAGHQAVHWPSWWWRTCQPG
jgi:hypothetical protein